MDEVLQIVTYSAENHSIVTRLFSNGMLEHRKAAVKTGLKSTKVQALLFSVFCLGYVIHSVWLAMGAALVLMALQAYLVCWCFNEYVRNSLNTDMKDAALQFWTTKPNVFLVAKIQDKIVGCIAYQKISEDTVEMNRTSVDKDFRGLKIGEKLVTELLKVAKSEGYTKMYLTTGNAMKAPIKLYEKLGFQFMGNLGLPFDNVFVALMDLITGIYRVSYVKEL